MAKKRTKIVLGISQMSKRKVYAVLSVGKPNGLPDETITSSRVGLDFACMDVALEKETFRLHVWSDRAWELTWAPRRWKEADEEDAWVMVARGNGTKVASRARKEKLNNGLT